MRFTSAQRFFEPCVRIGTARTASPADDERDAGSVQGRPALRSSRARRARRPNRRRHLSARHRRKARLVFPAFGIDRRRPARRHRSRPSIRASAMRIPNRRTSAPASTSAAAIDAGPLRLRQREDRPLCVPLCGGRTARDGSTCSTGRSHDPAPFPALRIGGTRARPGSGCARRCQGYQRSSASKPRTNSARSWPQARQNSRSCSRSIRREPRSTSLT